MLEAFKMRPSALLLIFSSFYLAAAIGCESHKTNVAALEQELKDAKAKVEKGGKPKPVPPLPEEIKASGRGVAGRFKSFCDSLFEDCLTHTENCAACDVVPEKGVNENIRCIITCRVAIVACGAYERCKARLSEIAPAQ